MKKLAVLFVLVACLSAIAAAQGPLTNLMNLRGRTDSSGNLRVIGTTAVGAQTPLTPLANLRGRTDSSGNLYVTCSSGCGMDFGTFTFSDVGPGQGRWAVSGNTSYASDANGVIVEGQDYGYRWTSSGINNAIDTGVNRSSAGVVRATDGSTGNGSFMTVSLIGQGTAPTVANVGANSCGTNAATLSGTELSGVITVGATSGTQCRITFATAAPTRRQCVVTNETTANLSRTTYVDTTHTDVLGTFVGADKLSYVCAVY